MRFKGEKFTNRNSAICWSRTIFSPKLKSIQKSSNYGKELTLKVQYDKNTFQMTTNKSLEFTFLLSVGLPTKEKLKF